MSGDGGVEEVYRRRTSSTSDQVEQNFGCVGQPNLNVNRCPGTNDTSCGMVNAGERNQAC